MIQRFGCPSPPNCKFAHNSGNKLLCNKLAQPGSGAGGQPDSLGMLANDTIDPELPQCNDAVVMANPCSRWLIVAKALGDVCFAASTGARAQGQTGKRRAAAVFVFPSLD
jgi:hypothetical protein